MKGEERRKQLLNILSSSNNPVSGGTLAKELNVSRQIIVQDISLLRANGATIFSTNKGYLLQEDRKYSRVFKVYHTDDQVEEELSTIVDAGGQIRDVFVYHKVYGVLKADMGIISPRHPRLHGGNQHRQIQPSKKCNLRLPLSHHRRRKRRNSGCHSGRTSAEGVPCEITGLRARRFLGWSGIKTKKVQEPG